MERLVSTAPVEPPPAGGFVVRRGDAGAFRAALPGSDDVVVVRPLRAGLRVEQAGGVETAPWTDVTGIELTSEGAGAARVEVVRVRFRAGPPLDLADRFAPGADELPMTLEPAGPPLLRVERLRVLAATIATAAGLSPRSRDAFHRGGRGVAQAVPALKPPLLPRWASPVLAVLSVAALLVFFPELGVAGAAAIMAVLALHEIGHAMAMRSVGAGVRSMLFLPALGAATVPERAFVTRYDDARVALAGPCTGLPVAVAAILWRDPLPEAARWGVVFAVGLNLLNLLPLVPLDGGRLLLAVAAGLPRALRAVLAWLPLAAALAALLLLDDAPTTGITLLLVVSIVMTRLALRRQAFHQWMLDAGFDPVAVRRALCDVTVGLGGAPRDDVDGGVPAAPMSRGQVAAVLGMYAALVAGLGWATSVVGEVVPEMRILTGVSDGASGD